jgi:phage gp46-like protein
MAYQQTDVGLKLRGDIKFFYSQIGDLAPAENVWDSDINDVISDPGLETAILISLLSDKRASSDDVIPDLVADNRRGWWADALQDKKIGSKLWLLAREKTSAKLPSAIEDCINDALRWLITDGVAKATTCTVTRVSTNGYRIVTKIERATKNNIAFTFYYNWLSQTIGDANVI